MHTSTRYIQHYCMPIVNAMMVVFNRGQISQRVSKQCIKENQHGPGFCLLKTSDNGKNETTENKQVSLWLKFTHQQTCPHTDSLTGIWPQTAASHHVMTPGRQPCPARRGQLVLSVVTWVASHFVSCEKSHITEVRLIYTMVNNMAIAMRIRRKWKFGIWPVMGAHMWNIRGWDCLPTSNHDNSWHIPILWKK